MKATPPDSGLPLPASCPEPIGADAANAFAGQHVMVTGGEGFIGSHLVERLHHGGAIVTVLDRTPVSRLRNLYSLQGSVEYLHCDVVDANFDSLLAAHDYEAIYHLAGNASVPDSVSDPWDDFRCNVVATLRLMESLRRTGRPARLIIASSAAVYGDIDAPSIHEDAPTVPISPYGVSKLAIDRYAAVYSRLYGLRTATLRPFTVYGPRLRKQVVYDFIRKLTEGTGILEAHGDGTQVRDFCYVSDVVEAAIAVARSDQLRGEVYNVAAGQSCSIGELLRHLCDQLGIRTEVRWSGRVRPGEPQRWIPDMQRLRALGWVPTVSLEEGLRRTIAWYREEAQLARRQREL